MFSSSINLFRFSGLIEGSSLIILLFIAMPLKYMANSPEAVTIVGSIHGALFCIYLLMIAYTTITIRWAWKWPVMSVLVAFIPFGNFLLDYYIRKSNLTKNKMEA
ncbi:DUF3817 domain-containing protein [Aquibacillus kalidii]|uniref:DUF3817 domain-containing protein n=1 Tax=Aquibacillus kalidii TaxID=2762597 RepID=UPI0016481ED8|nr:DUF3817 domain-containing protein [Aquibacillus kalidii]